MILVLKSFLSKKHKSLLVIISLLFIIINFISLFSYTNNKKIDTRINNKDNRIIHIINTDDIDKYDKIFNYDNIIEVYKDIEPISSKMNNYNVLLDVINPEEQYDLIKGKLCKNSNEIVIPETIRVNEELLNLSKYYNKIIKIMINDQIKEYLVTGLYSNNNNDCFYTTNLDVVSNNYIALIDNYDNLNIVINKLEDDGYIVGVKDSSQENSLSTFKSLNIFINIFNYVCIVILIILLFLFILISIIDSKYNIALLKTYGFNNIKILLCLFLISIIIIFISFFISIIITFILNYLIKIFFEIHLYDNLIVLLKNLIFIFIINIIENILSFFIISKINIIKLLKAN